MKVRKPVLNEDDFVKGEDEFIRGATAEKIVKKAVDTRKQPGRPAKKDPSKLVAFNLPLWLIDKIAEEAELKTSGNKSLLVTNVLTGKMKLEAGKGSGGAR